MEFDQGKQPHRRFNPLTGEWVLVSPHRNKRPWKGQEEKLLPIKSVEYDSDCYLCPGNTRANGVINPDYQSTFVFENDFSALQSSVTDFTPHHHLLLRSQAIEGVCRVVCFSPQHNTTLADMPVDQINSVIDLWMDQSIELGNRYRWVQIFENRGEIMGCSNPHPHCQIWALDQLPNEPQKEDQQQREYCRQNNSILLMDYLKLENELQERLVAASQHWVAVVPYWAVWPFEILLLPKHHVPTIGLLDESQRHDLANILKKLLTKYDNLFDVSFPYTMGWHGAPREEADQLHWQLHAHFYPPLLRSSTIRKFMVGFEMLAEAQRDLTAEQAAGRLRDTSEISMNILSEK